MRFQSRKSESRLTAEQKALSKQEEELRKKREALEKKLRGIPAAMEKKRERARELQRLDTTTTAYPEYFRRVRHERDDRGPRRQILRKDRRRGKLTFFALCVILAVMMLLLWYAIPS